MLPPITGVEAHERGYHPPFKRRLRVIRPWGVSVEIRWTCCTTGFRAKDIPLPPLCYLLPVAKTHQYKVHKEVLLDGQHTLTTLTIQLSILSALPRIGIYAGRDLPISPTLVIVIDNILFDPCRPQASVHHHLCTGLRAMRICQSQRNTQRQHMSIPTFHGGQGRLRRSRMMEGRGSRR